MAAEGTGGRTKRALVGALRELLREKPLAQIRVRELAELCGIRRQSFYYHFADVYELLAWSVRQERETLERRRERLLTWRQALQDLLGYTAENRAYYRALLESQGRESLRQVLQDAVTGLLDQTVSYYQARCGAPGDAAERRRMVDCYASVLLALLESWICGDLRHSPEELLDLLENTVRRSVCGAAWQNLPRGEPSGL